MNELKNFVIALMGWIIIITISILVMIHGWGLYPKHWLIVIFGSSAGFLVGQLFIALSKSK